MTDEELIAQARELLKQELDYHSNSPHAGADVVCRLITTHLAEMDEHYNNFVEENYNIFESVEGWYCQGCFERNDSDTPCQKLLTKAKRLLGVE